MLATPLHATELLHRELHSKQKSKHHNLQEPSTLSRGDKRPGPRAAHQSLGFFRVWTEGPYMMEPLEGNVKEGPERNMKMESEHSVKGEDAKWRRA